MADSFNITVDTRELLDFASKYKKKAVDRVLRFVSLDLEREAKIEAPVRDGFLSKTIAADRIKALVYAIRIKALYWRYVQFKTRAHVIRAKNVKALRFKWKGGFVFFKKVNHPGTEANPFLDRAIDKVEPNIPGHVKRALQEIGSASS